MTWSNPDKPHSAHATMPMSVPTRDTVDRLELSADHVVGERCERVDHFGAGQFVQLLARFIRVIARLFQRLVRAVAPAHGLHYVPRFVLAEPAVVVDFDRREHQWKSRESFSNVVAGWLTHLVFRACVVEHIVSDLKCEPQLAAI